MSDEIKSDETKFTQEDYDKLFNLLQNFFNLKTKLKDIIKTLQMPNYVKPSNDKTYEESIKNTYNICVNWYESFEEALKKISDDKRTSKWLASELVDFKKDIELFASIVKI